MVGTQENIPDTVGTAAKTENTTGADLDRAAFGKAGEEEETGDGLEEREKEKRDIIEQTILEKYNQYYRVAYSYTHNDADACDIVQNGAYRALRGSSSLRKTEYASTWVYRIMLNECFRHMKRPQNLSYEYIKDAMKREPFYMEDKSENLDIRRALDSLSEQDKAVIVLRFFEDMKLEEIADILGENLSTIKSRLYRSIKKLRSVLDENT